MKSDRPTQRLHFAQHQLRAADLHLVPASTDASFRSYWRTKGTPHSVIVMDAPPDKEDLHPWIDVAQRLRSAGLNAPEVLAQDLEHGFLLIGDLGSRTYLNELNGNADALYGAALDALFTMQTKVNAEHLPPYNEARLVAEMELLPEWFLRRHLGHTLECDEWDILEAAFRTLANAALAQPRAFVHRDYHSRNLLITDGNSPGIIDFQDAVLGPITYDLASLLRDCYIAWPEPQLEDWVEQYRLRLVHAGITHVDRAQFQRWFDLMGLQRHIKVLGIFCRLMYRDGKPGYLKDLPLVLHYTRSVAARYPEFDQFRALLDRVIGNRDVALPIAA